ncbi:MAG TPA: hypothetical protein EYP40_01860 [Chromatiales bacterium]|nr:hypothetical protein [Chromatiales bacterium]
MKKHALTFCNAGSRISGFRLACLFHHLASGETGRASRHRTRMAPPGNRRGYATIALRSGKILRTTMNVPYDLLSPAWHWVAAGLYLLVLIPAVLTASWQRFRQQEAVHVFLGSCVGLLVMWHITTTTFPGLNYHYIGATLLTLMFGWQLALVAYSLVYLGMMLNGSSDWQTLPLNILVTGLVPILATHLIYRIVDRRLPNHFFVYIFLNAFFGAGLALVAMIGVASGILILGGVYRLDHLLTEYYPFIPLMVFPESFITGMLITVMVAMAPSWVCTFDDVRYLHGK